MKVLWGIILVVLCSWRIGAWAHHLWLFDNPPPTAPASACPNSQTVTVNGIHVGCTGDERGPAGHIWTPEPGMAPMAPLSKKTQEWMDAP